MVPKSGAASKPTTLDAPLLLQQPGTAEAHAGDLGATLTGAADKLGMVFADEDMGSETGSRPLVPRVSRSKVTGALGDEVRRCLSVVGLAATSIAATALAAGKPTPATGIALFVLLLGGLSLVSIGVVGGANGHGCDGDDVSLA